MEAFPALRPLSALSGAPTAKTVPSLDKLEDPLLAQLEVFPPFISEPI